jgi:hypothetical protein
LNGKRIARNIAFATLLASGAFQALDAQANAPQKIEQQPGCRFVGLGGSVMSCICGPNREIHWPQDCEGTDANQVTQTQQSSPEPTVGNSGGFPWEAAAGFAGVLGLAALILGRKK